MTRVSPESTAKFKGRASPQPEPGERDGRRTGSGEGVDELLELDPEEDQALELNLEET